MLDVASSRITRPRIAREGAGEPEELPLALGQPPTFLSDFLGVPARQLRDEPVCAHLLRGVLHDPPVRGGVVKRDVFRDCSCEEKNILRHRGYRATQLCKGNLAHVRSVQENASFVVRRTAASRG